MKSIYVPCDCKCCTLEISKDEYSYNISVLDSYYDHEANGVLNRIKRALMALFGKPVYFNDVSLSPDRYEKLLEQMRELMDE